jgi:flagellar M-ring protein FliF
MGNLSILGRQLKELWSHFGASQKVSVILAFVVTAVAIIGLMTWSARPSYRLLYSGLSYEDAAKAREKLEEDRILVELRDSGHSLYVPAGDVYRGRLLLASAGLPKNTSVGLEMFEQPRFGLTDFAQGINYQRALQGELQSTIASMDGIDSARVLLVLPKDKLFSSDESRKASASVMVSVPASLTAEQVRSMKYLVAAGVPGLNAADVTISDQNGHLISRGGAGESEEGAEAGGQMEIREKTEARLTSKAQRMLDAALGPGRSTAQVSVELDFSKIERQLETYDAEGRVLRSETTSSESTSAPGAMDAGAAAGVAANVPVGNPAAGTLQQGTAKTKREDIDSKYEVPKTVERVSDSGVRIKSLSISVCVAAGAAPRPAVEVERLKSMVGAAVGAVKSGARTDSVELIEVAFAPPPEAAKPGWTETVPALFRHAQPALLALGVIVALLVFRKRMMAGLAIEKRDVGMPLASMIASSSGPHGVGAHSEQHLDDSSDLELISSIGEQEPRALATWITSVSGEKK